jgi:hypothetical protein
MLGVKGVVRILTSSDGTRRVLLVDRGDGRFGYEVEHLDDEVGWLPQRQRPFCICDSAATAEREARGAVAWLRDLAAPVAEGRMAPFDRASFRSATDEQRAALCNRLAADLSVRVRGAARFHDSVMAAIAELRNAGHDLWSFDADDDFEIWGPNYATPTGPGIIIMFHLDEATTVGWQTSV